MVRYLDLVFYPKHKWSDLEEVELARMIESELDVQSIMGKKYF